jgi:hypothetical protein
LINGPIIFNIKIYLHRALAFRKCCLPVLSATQAHTTHLTSRQVAVSLQHREKNGSFSHKYAYPDNVYSGFVRWRKEFFATESRNGNQKVVRWFEALKKVWPSLDWSCGHPMPTRCVLYEWFKKYEKNACLGECGAAGRSPPSCQDIVAELYAGEEGGGGAECDCEGDSNDKILYGSSAVPIMETSATESAVQYLVAKGNMTPICPKTAAATAVSAVLVSSSCSRFLDAAEKTAASFNNDVPNLLNPAIYPPGQLEGAAAAVLTIAAGFGDCGAGA